MSFTNICKVRMILLLIVMIASVGTIVAADEGFKYNPKSKRDPFVPLVSESGNYASDAHEASAAEDIRLEGIVWDDVKGSIAIINGEIIKEADSIGTMKLLKINKDNVVFDINGENVKIDLNNE